MKIVADENIPLLEHYFGSYSELVVKPGRLISQNDLRDADILLVRSVTVVDKALLHDTPIKFVGSATTGSDHVDIDYLKKNNIFYSIANGCNANAVTEYILCVIAALQNQNLLSHKKLRAAVIGVGNIGSRIIDKLQLLGFDVVAYDPFKNKMTWHEIVDVDFVTIQTPLTTQGEYPTYHLIEKNFLQRQKKNCVILNVGRGAVINFSDLKKYGNHLHWCLDVWEQEPDIDQEVLQRAKIATPHIAGYSLQGKLRGIAMVYEDILRKKIIPDYQITPFSFPRKVLTSSANTWQEIALTIYNPLMTTQQLKSGRRFDELRKNFPERYEFSYVDIEGSCLNEKEKLLLS